MIVGFVTAIVWVPVFILVTGHVFASFPNPDDPASNQDFNPFRMIGPLLAMEAGLFLFSIACQYVYTVELMLRWNGQTVGKRILKIRVVPLNPTLRLTRGMVAKRFLITAVVALAGFVSLVDGLWQLWDKPFRQCLHDKVAATVVVLEPSQRLA